MASLHRLQWVDAQIRSGRFPNTRTLAEAFEISRCQAQRDFDYLRDSLGAPLAYSAVHRGFFYESSSFILPGAYVSPTQKAGLGQLAAYYRQVIRQGPAGTEFYAEMAALFSRLAGEEESGRTLRKHDCGIVPFRAILTAGSGAERRCTALDPYYRGADEERRIYEFEDPDGFIAALVEASAAFRIEWPNWLRNRLLTRVKALEAANSGASINKDDCLMKTVDPSSCDRPPLLSLNHQPGGSIESPGTTQRGQRNMSVTQTGRNETGAGFQGCWGTYMGAIKGILDAAGLSNLEMPILAGMSGMAFQLIIHESCCPSSATMYEWNAVHHQALDRLGVLSEVHMALPDQNTYSAACRHAIRRIREAIDNGTGVLLWGVDTAEFGVVRGYDDGDGVFLVDGIAKFASTAGSAPILYENIGRTSDVPILHYQIPIERVDIDAEQAYRSSLEHYVRQMEKNNYEWPAYQSGLKAYDSWIGSLERGDYNPFGLRYLTAVYAESKAWAAKYLRFLEGQWRAFLGLPEIASGFADIAALYREMVAILEEGGKTGGEYLQQPVDAIMASALAVRLRKAVQIEKRVTEMVKRGL